MNRHVTILAKKREDLLSGKSSLLNEFCLKPFVFPVSSVHNNDNNKCSSDVDPLPGFNKNEAAILFKKLAQSYQEISNLKSCLTDVTSEKNVFYEQLIESK